MARQRNMVPFGYETPIDAEKGTLFVMDSFESFGKLELYRLQVFAEHRSFARVVFYPFHEETVKRMGKKMNVRPFVTRLKEMEYLLEEISETMPMQMEKWEGKRKKYTPMDTALKHLTEKYPAPHFVYMSGEVANCFASYPVFEAWIRKLRLFIDIHEMAVPLHPQLEKYQHRWEYVLN